MLSISDFGPNSQKFLPIDMLNSKQAASATVSEASIDHQEIKIPRWRRVVGLVWDSFEGEPRDRKYIQKLDGYML